MNFRTYASCKRGTIPVIYNFLGWLRAMSLAGSVIMNDMRYIEWNANKKYMLELQADGVSMPRTVAMDCSDVACSRSPFRKWAW